MNAIEISYNDDKMIITNNLNPHVPQKHLIFLQIITELQLQEVVDYIIRDITYYYMEQNNLF